MDIHNIQITAEDLEQVAAEARPGEPVSFVGDACSVYRNARPALIVAQAVLQFAYPPASGAVTALVAIMDKACEIADEVEENETPEEK